MPDLIPKHGGYRNLKSFHFARLVYDITVRFCERYIDRFSRSRDQMVQAARSGVQNIAEGSSASGTSKKTELKFTQVARASLEELKLDYEDYLHQHNISQWQRNDPVRQNLLKHNFQSADQVAEWITKACKEKAQNTPEITDHQTLYPEYSANTAIALINLTCYFLDKQVAKLAENFKKEGGFTERLYNVRKEARIKQRTDKADLADEADIADLTAIVRIRLASEL